MKFYWDCKNPKCLSRNESQINGGHINDDGSILFDLGPCCKCGNPHRFFTIWNQRIEVEKIGVRKS